MGGRLALRPALRWIARSDTPEIFTAAALLLVVATAALMQSVGLSMALGAFLAGVLLAESDALGEGLAEAMEALVVPLMANYDAVLTPATSQGKNFSPRIAAKLDVAQISEVIEVVSADTFVRPIYAGNALETVQSADAKKVLTVRPTAFKAAGDPNVYPEQIKEGLRPWQPFKVYMGGVRENEPWTVRIDSGEYGWCDETGEPIGLRRLLARPTATLSLEAQERREMRQKMFGD